MPPHEEGPGEPRELPSVLTFIQPGEGGVQENETIREGGRGIPEIPNSRRHSSSSIEFFMKPIFKPPASFTNAPIRDRTEFTEKTRPSKTHLLRKCHMAQTHVTKATRQSARTCDPKEAFIAWMSNPLNPNWKSKESLHAEAGKNTL